MIYWLDPAHDAKFRAPLCATLWLSGDVDLADSAALGILGRDVETLTSLHVDLGEVSYVGAALLSWLLATRDALSSHGGRLTIGRLTSRTLHVLTLGGLQRCFDLRPNPRCHPRHALRPTA